MDDHLCGQVTFDCSTDDALPSSHDSTTVDGLRGNTESTVVARAEMRDHPPARHKVVLNDEKVGGLTALGHRLRFAPLGMVGQTWQHTNRVAAARGPVVMVKPVCSRAIAV
jgi:hypothetical protein